MRPLDVGRIGKICVCDAPIKLMAAQRMRGSAAISAALELPRFDGHF